MKFFPVFVLFLAITSNTIAQRYSFIQFSTDKGLPQSQVNTITQDKKGYLWVGTNGGLARFDGKNFTNYGTNSGLLNNRTTKVQFISDTLFVGHPQGISVAISDSSFEAIPYSDDSLLVDVTGFALIHSTIYVSTNGNGLFSFNRGGKKLTPIKNSPVRIRDLINYKGEIYLATRTGLYNFDGKSFKLIGDSGDISFSGIKLEGNHLLATSYNGTLYKVNIEQSQFIPLYKNDFYLLRNLIIDNHNNKWLYSQDGIIILKQKDTLKLSESSGLPTNDIDVIFKDDEDNIWIGTNGKGLIRFTSEVFTYFNEAGGFPSDIIIAMEIDSHKNKWISTIDHGVFKIEPSGKVVKIDYIQSAVWQIKSTRRNVLFGSNYGFFSYDYTSFKGYYMEDGLPSDRIRGILPLNDTSILISTSNGGIEFNPKEKSLDHKESIYRQIQGARDFEILDGTLYATAPNGICTIKDNQIKHENIKSGINSITSDQKGRIWVGTENGLFIKDKNSYERFHIEKKNRIEFVNFLQSYDSLIFVGTNNGLYEIGTSLKYIFHYGITSGLIGLETNLNSNYLEDNKYLWFGTASGLMRMDLSKRNDLKRKSIPKIRLTEIVINNKELSPDQIIALNDKANTQKLILKYADKNITFSFDGIYMTNSNSLRYSYFLEGFSSNWSQKSKNPNANFTNLPIGEYTFKFKVESGNSESTIFSIPIKVLPPFYRTWWFYLFSGFMILFIVFILDRRRSKQLAIKNHQIKLEFQNKLSKLEQQSLNSSMNRHFIFNALNSIQYYINTSDTRAANKYLSKFAKLIRKNLDSTYHEDGMVPLSDEIERLKLYLELETMRFKDRFDYSFVIEDTVETEVLKVPAMFLQPFVENSIIHGVLPLKDRKGEIIIYITDHFDNIQIKIQDNGVGIDKSRTDKKESQDTHRSHGMTIAKNKIELLQKISARSIIMIGPHQLKGNDSLINGTVVSFKILKQFME